MLRSVSARRLPKPLAVVLTVALALFWVLAVPPSSADAATGGFVIDGVKNPLPAGTQTVADPIGNADTTVYSNGAKENDPSGWMVNGSAGAPDSGDIGNSYVATGYDGDFWLYFAFDRVAPNGSIGYALELNQAENTKNTHGTVVPRRTVGDLRFSLEQGGNGAFSVTSVERWSGSGWTGYNAGSNVTYKVSTDKQFVEFAFNLSKILKPVLGEIECGELAFQNLWLRSRSSDSAQSQLKDFATGGISLDSCAGLTIIKADERGADLAGAKFKISPNPLPQGSGDLVKTTGADGVISLPAVNAGTYTVTEVSPPQGYLFEPGAKQTVDLAPTQDKSLSFTNSLGQVEFTKTYEGKQPAKGATFTLEYLRGWDFSTGTPTLSTSHAGHFRPITVVDNGTGDDAAALGKILVDQVPSGEWRVTETAAPTGWGVDPAPQTFVVGPHLAQKDGAFTAPSDGAFHDPLLKVDLLVAKTESSAGSEAPLAGVVFNLYLDDGDGVAQPGAADTLVGSQTTDTEGFASWIDLNWQKQYWLQETVPTGYDTSLSPNPQLVTFTAPTKDGQVTTVAVDNPRREVTISLAKTDAYNGEKLTGGTFQLWRDMNGNGKVDEGVDVRVGANKALEQGHVSWTPQDSDTPWGYTYLIYEATAPTGYGLMSPNPIAVPTTVGDAGKTINHTATDPRLPAGLKMLKVDDYDQPVEGAGFALYLDDGDGTAELGTDDELVPGSAQLSGADGSLVWQGLTWGESYWVQETSAPAGYQKMTPNPVLVTIPKSAAGKTHEVAEPMVDPRTKSSLKVLKVDELDKSTALAGAEFTLWLDHDRNGAINNGDVSIGERVTGADGVATFTDLLVWGHQYLLQETAAPAGYGFMSPNPLTIEVNRGEAGTTIKRMVKDPRTPAGLQVRKTDAEQPDLPVAGASFKLWLDDGDGKLNPCGEVPSSCDIPVQDVRVTDANGLTEAWTGLTYGFTYLVQEVAPFPNGYAAMSPNPKSVTLTRDDAGRTVVVEVTDPRKPSDLVVTKLDATSKEKLDGAIFQLWEDTDRDGTPDTELAERVVGDGTAVFKDLVVWGHDYWLLETEAPEGYDLMSPNPVAVPNADAPGNVRDVITMTVKDPRTPSDVTVYKADSKTGEPVVGAEFELYLDHDGDGKVTEADGEPIANAITANTGTFELEDLIWGLDYLLVETAVPAGYGYMTPNPLPITLETAGDTTLTIADPRLTVDLPVIKVAAGEQGQPLAGAQFALWQESNGVDGLQRDGEDADTATGLTCTTGDDGTCTVTGVDWGPGDGAAYYWVETVAPDGYNLPTVDWAGPVWVTAQDATTQAGGENPFEAVAFADDVTGLTTTPFVNDEPGDLARVDDGDEVSDRAELTGLSTPAGGDVDFLLYGPFEVDAEGALTEDVTCDADPVYASLDRPLSWDAESERHLAFSHGHPVTELAPGMYQWVASYSGDTKNRGATGACPDVTEQVLVRAGDAPGVDKASDPQSGSVVQPGTQLTYTVTASNTGDMPIPADEAVVVDTLPEWLYFEGMVPAVPAQPEPEVTENEDGTTTLRWQIGELAGGASVTLTYLVSVFDDVPQGTVLENRAEFLDQRDTTTHVVPEGDLTVVKTADPANGTGVTVGEEITYTMTVTATGELNQRDVLVADYVPGSDPYLTESVSTTYVPGSAACSGECMVTEPDEDGLVIWELGDMAAGTSRTVSFAVTVDQINVSGTGTVEVGDVLNIAWVESFDTPPVESNQVEHPVTLVLGTKVTAPKPTAKPKPKPAVQVLGVKLPRTGAELGTAIWLAGALLLLGGAMVLVARRRRGA